MDGVRVRTKVERGEKEPSPFGQGKQRKSNCQCHTRRQQQQQHWALQLVPLLLLVCGGCMAIKLGAIRSHLRHDTRHGTVRHTTMTEQFAVGGCCCCCNIEQNGIAMMLFHDAEEGEEEKELDKDEFKPLPPIIFYPVRLQRHHHRRTNAAAS